MLQMSKSNKEPAVLISSNPFSLSVTPTLNWFIRWTLAQVLWFPFMFLWQGGIIEYCLDGFDSSELGHLTWPKHRPSRVYSSRFCSYKYRNPKKGRYARINGGRNECLKLWPEERAENSRSVVEGLTKASGIPSLGDVHPLTDPSTQISRLLSY